MSNRWRQENYFKYAREHFAPRRPRQLRRPPDDLDPLVPNPAKARARDQVAGARTDPIGAHAEMADALDAAFAQAGRPGSRPNASC